MRPVETILRMGIKEHDGGVKLKNRKRNKEKMVSK
jgi:hypothetical protein